MLRGIERAVIFRDDTDRADFLARLAALVEGGALSVYAWALLANHAHLLVRTGSRPLPASMRSLLTGYAGAFNRRHRRVGHLFQNRYKSIVVEEEPYLLELVRYLHLNPVRAKVVSDLRALDRYHWTGHSALVGTVPRPCQGTQTILAQFGPTRLRARAGYRDYVTAGSPRAVGQTSRAGVWSGVPVVGANWRRCGGNGTPWPGMRECLGVASLSSRRGERPVHPTPGHLDGYPWRSLSHGCAGTRELPRLN